MFPRFQSNPPPTPEAPTAETAPWPRWPLSKFRPLLSREREQIHLWGFLIVFYALPPTLFWATGSPHWLNYLVFSALVFFLLIYLRIGRFTPHELGLRAETLKPSLLWSGLVSAGLAALVLAIYLGSWLRHSYLIPSTLPYLIFYALVACPAQEFVYRGLLFAEFKRRGWQQPGLQIALSSFLFAFLHSFHYDYVTFGVTLVAGLAWSLIYQKYPNLLGVTLSHGVLGILAILTHLV